MQEGLKEGWLAGFEDGAEFGIKKVFTDAYMKGIDLSALDLKDYIDMNKLRREKMNEFERLFRNIDHSDKAEKLGRVIEEYKQFSQKKKLKYATMGKKNLMKLVNAFYHEKLTKPKHFLVEVIYDQTQLKFGNEGISNKKLY